MAGEIKNWDDFRAMLRGRMFLVGVDLLDANDAVIQKYQTAGVVEDLTSDGFFLLRRKDDSVFTIPYDPKTIKPADKGEYRLNASGSLVIDPDYIITWNVVLKSEDDIANFKAHGFARTSD